MWVMGWEVFKTVIQDDVTTITVHNSGCKGTKKASRSSGTSSAQHASYVIIACATCGVATNTADLLIDSGFQPRTLRSQRPDFITRLPYGRTRINSLIL
ncbi:hypothetical protein AVEN_118685-1 [Araneus ventricosus]|uniref:Uncharacterized protein n=1 Tax=Araneus ventricosus TaxID=182803 RepID=A0A4Y2AYQ5_ARAVE|nr:hypothetical protein AVEN_118685-1 [Araneus ventricosus]